MECNNCKKDTVIVNKRYGLCNNCNSIRITGKTLQERQFESSVKYREKSIEKFRQRVTLETDQLILPNRYAFKKHSKPVKQQTSNEAIIKGKLSELKRSIRLDAVQDNKYYCCGCGKGSTELDCSHILSIGQFKQYELVRGNIQLLCRSCHKIWESGTIQQQIKLHCFVDNLQFIYTLEPLVHQKFITRIEEYRMWLIEDQDKAKIHVIDQILDQVRA